ncbi:hypothetical protein AB0M39_41170 [Streptomyces sp. NPDC051907]|uniref:hypothetical protein n=1 Tax=Streptomyces sp. NPDC051907 TaxID=3155284 RepID=UPI00342B80BA
MTRIPAVQAAVRAAAEAARLANSAPADQAAALREASGHWSVLADLLMGGVRMPKAWVREHAQAADEMAARAGGLAPSPCAQAIIDALYA